VWRLGDLREILIFGIACEEEDVMAEYYVSFWRAHSSSILRLEKHEEGLQRA